MAAPVRPVKILVRQRTWSMSTMVLPAVTRTFIAQLTSRREYPGSILPLHRLRNSAETSEAGLLLCKGRTRLAIELGEVAVKRLVQRQKRLGQARFHRPRPRRDPQLLQIQQQYLARFRLAAEHQ